MLFFLKVLLAGMSTAALPHLGWQVSAGGWQVIDDIL